MFTEFRFAARALSRSLAGGALAAMLTLSIGIGTTTAVYALTSVMVADFPGVPDIDRLARIYAASPALGVERAPVAVGDVDSTLSHFTSFAATGAYQQETVTIGTRVAERNVTGGSATPGFFTVMGVSPVAGRLFTSADSRRGTRRRHRERGAVAARLRRRPPERPDHRPRRRRAGNRRRDAPNLLVLFVGVSARCADPLVGTPGGASAAVSVFARLRPGAAWSAAASELGSRGRAPWTWRAIPIQDDVQQRATIAFAFTLGPALLLLLIGCVNVSCMLMARGIERDAEFTIRARSAPRACGSSGSCSLKTRCSRREAARSGCGLAVATLRVVSSALAAEQQILAERVVAGFDLLPLALVATMASCVLFGTLPAVRLSGGTSPRRSTACPRSIACTSPVTAHATWSSS